MRPCCRKPGIHRRFAENATDIAQRAQQPRQQAAGGSFELAPRVPPQAVAGVLLQMGYIFWCISFFLRLSCAYVERMHTISRLITLSGRNVFSTVSGMVLVQQAKERYKLWRQSRMEQHKPTAGQIQAVPKGLRKAKSPREEHRAQYLKDHPGANPANPAVAASIKADWAAADEGKKALFEARSRLSHAAVHAAKLQLQEDTRRLALVAEPAGAAASAAAAASSGVRGLALDAVLYDSDVQALYPIEAIRGDAPASGVPENERHPFRLEVG